MKNGFTLIEIMVVIAIIALVSSVSWVALNNYRPSLELRAVARNIATDLRLAQQLSVSEQINHGIFFDLDNKKYQLKKFGTVTQDIFSKNLPSIVNFCGITGLSTGNYAIFNPYGAVLATGSVCLVSSNGQQKIIEIKPSGFVKIQD